MNKPTSKIKLAILLLCALLLSPQAQAQTALNQQQTEILYQGCLKRPTPTMTGETLNTFCQCTALHTQKNMTMEEIRAQAGTDQAARNALNKVITHVYAPCMQFPVRALIEKKCAANKEIKNPKVCACSADKMSQYTQREAQIQLPRLFAENPNIADPNEAFMGSASFRQAEEQIADFCVKSNQ